LTNAEVQNENNSSELMLYSSKTTFIFGLIYDKMALEAMNNAAKDYCPAFGMERFRVPGTVFIPVLDSKINIKINLRCMQGTSCHCCTTIASL